VKERKSALPRRAGQKASESCELAMKSPSEKKRCCHHHMLKNKFPKMTEPLVEIDAC